MATQGLVTVMTGREVIFIVVAGCDGYNYIKLVEKIKETRHKKLNLEKLAKLAGEVGFGCHDCLVVMGKKSSFGAIEDLHERYRRTFKKPNFNPRWEQGTADYVEVINIST